MDSTVFKYKRHHYQQQNQNHFNRTNNNNNIISRSSNISSHNHNNQNPIFILNTTTRATATKDILPNNPQLYYADLNENNVVSSASSTPSSALSTTASSSVWSSASATMCSPAAHALQKLFNCSSNNLKLNQGNYSGIESNGFKSKSEILKKKSKFWKYLEGEANDKSNQRGIDDDTDVSEKKVPRKGFKFKTKYWAKSYGSDNQNQQDLSELLEYSCSLCDDCRCIDCQIGYFDCENSDDNNSEYSFHLSAYEEDDDPDDIEKMKELKTSKDRNNENCCNNIGSEQDISREFEMESKMPSTCCMSYSVCNELNCAKAKCCQQCFIESIEGDGEEDQKHHIDFVTNRNH